MCPTISLRSSKSYGVSTLAKHANLLKVHMFVYFSLHTFNESQRPKRSLSTFGHYRVARYITLALVKPQIQSRAHPTLTNVVPAKVLSDSVAPTTNVDSSISR